jgi:heterotetrameric sarcosine oxidase gamma subunit
VPDLTNRRSALAKAQERHELIRQRNDLCIQRLYAPAHGFTENLGLDLPYQPNRATEGEGVCVLWLTPGEWLVVGAVPGLGTEAEAQGGAVSDLSHGRVAFRLPADLGREVLAKGSPLDLRGEVFLPGHCAQSMLSGVAILVHCPAAGDHMDLYVARSYGRFIHDRLLDAAPK